ncbi:dihydroorotate dehydrogenase electron transfer subunit [candidate division WOR-3 bacterium]|uniref:Dihydroorotate dehydrogenase electron transfer subunit n=1 Tax=candidate division WOR-3 bacterium TaxID=2052148 RepID=A0A937XJA7_UNCW3|nr:dihydroorotate dehydrogenase electron transfer subunit [candidate division WOR-3 bacterium]
MKPIRCPVVQARGLCAGVFSLWLEAPEIARRVSPGQFLNVRVSDGVDPLLRRPISVCDVERSRVRLLFRVVGRGTALLGRVRAGDELDVLGPLGRPAPEPHRKEILLCGGGIGTAPLLLLARRLKRNNRLRVLLGARAKDELLLAKEFRALGLPVSLATDDGSAGFHGMVTELAETQCKVQSGGRRSAASRQPSVVFACGPRPMLADLVKRLDPIPVWGFVEERMGCGTGICYCCALPKKGGGHIRFCEQGPVVRLNEVVF